MHIKPTTSQEQLMRVHTGQNALAEAKGMYDLSPILNKK